MNQCKIDMFKHCHLFCFLLVSVCLHLTARAQVLPLTAEMRAMIGKSYKIVEQKIEDADPDDEHAAKAIVVPDLKGWRFDDSLVTKPNSQREACPNALIASEFYKDGPIYYGEDIIFWGQKKYIIYCSTAVKKNAKIYITIKWQYDKKRAVIADVLNIEDGYSSHPINILKKSAQKNLNPVYINEDDWSLYSFSSNPFVLIKKNQTCEVIETVSVASNKNFLFWKYHHRTGNFSRAYPKRPNHFFVPNIDLNQLCPENP